MTGLVGHKKGRAVGPPQIQSGKDKTDQDTSTARGSAVWAVVVLNWNKSALTLDCIDSVDNALQLCPDLVACKILVDNGSEISERTALETGLTKRDRWNLVKLSNNEGYASGMNAGFQLALSIAKPSRTLFLNNDLLLAPNALQSLLREEKHQGLSTITGLTLSTGEGAWRQDVRGYRYWSWLGIARSVTQPSGSLDYISGAAMLVDNTFLNNIGGIPNRSFLYFEELRLIAALNKDENFQCCAAATAEHRGGTTANTLLTRPSRHYYAAISCFRFTRDYHPFKLPTVIFARILGLLVTGGLRLQLAPTVDACRALLDFIAGREVRHHISKPDLDASPH